MTDWDDGEAERKRLLALEGHVGDAVRALVKESDGLWSEITDESMFCREAQAKADKHSASEALLRDQVGSVEKALSALGYESPVPF